MNTPYPQSDYHTNYAALRTAHSEALHDPAMLRVAAMLGYSASDDDAFAYQLESRHQIGKGRFSYLCTMGFRNAQGSFDSAWQREFASEDEPLCTLEAVLGLDPPSKTFLGAARAAGRRLALLTLLIPRQSNPQRPAGGLARVLGSTWP